MTSPPPSIDSRRAFHAALAWGFESAVAAGARRIVCCDPDFAHWSWDEPATLEILQAWLRLPRRALVLLARSYAAFPQDHPRFTRWRADRVHAIEAWQVVDEMASELPSVLVADKAVSVQLLDAVHWRGRASDEAAVALRWRDALDVVLQRAEPGFAVRTLGL
jgi:hypothetical protein